MQSYSHKTNNRTTVIYILFTLMFFHNLIFHKHNLLNTLKKFDHSHNLIVDEILFDNIYLRYININKNHHFFIISRISYTFKYFYLFSNYLFNFFFI